MPRMVRPLHARAGAALRMAMVTAFGCWCAWAESAQPAMPASVPQAESAAPAELPAATPAEAGAATPSGSADPIEPALSPPPGEATSAPLESLPMLEVAQAEPLPVPLAQRESVVKQQVVEAMKAGRFRDLFAGMDQYRALEREGARVPAGLYFAEAEAALSMGDGVRAKRAYDDYFRVAGSKDALYRQATFGYEALKEAVPDSLKPILDDMVLVPAGVFQMGSAGNAQEAPARQVRVAPFAIGRHEVTRQEFLAFTTATNYMMVGGNGDDQEFCDLRQVDWRRPGFEQTDLDPVVCVSSYDAKAYIDWLNVKTGLKFRLPSEAEWEYAARGQTGSAYWWGDAFDAHQANGQGASDDDRWANGTAPVGSFPASPFGLFDMNGNAAEWVADCWHDNYEGAPADDAVWRSGDCAWRVLRGGGWVHFPEQLTSSARLRKDAAYRATYLGFRLAI